MIASPQAGHFTAIDDGRRVLRGRIAGSPVAEARQDRYDRYRAGTSSTLHVPPTSRRRRVPQFGHRRCVASRGSSPGALICDSTRAPQLGQASASRSSRALTTSRRGAVEGGSGRRCHRSRSRTWHPLAPGIADGPAFVFPTGDPVAGRVQRVPCCRGSSTVSGIEWPVPARVLHQPRHRVLLTVRMSRLRLG
jgi:hypothetical protein